MLSSARSAGRSGRFTPAARIYALNLPARGVVARLRPHARFQSGSAGNGSDSAPESRLTRLVFSRTGFVVALVGVCYVEYCFTGRSFVFNKTDRDFAKSLLYDWFISLSLKPSEEILLFFQSTAKAYADFMPEAVLIVDLAFDALDDLHDPYCAEVNRILNSAYIDALRRLPSHSSQKDAKNTNTPYYGIYGAPVLMTILGRLLLQLHALAQTADSDAFVKFRTHYPHTAQKLGELLQLPGGRFVGVDAGFINAVQNRVDIYLVQSLLDIEKIIKETLKLLRAKDAVCKGPGLLPRGLTMEEQDEWCRTICLPRITEAFRKFSSFDADYFDTLHDFAHRLVDVPSGTDSEQRTALLSSNWDEINRLLANVLRVQNQVLKQLRKLEEDTKHYVESKNKVHREIA